MIHKYTTEEARSLQAYGELPASARINQTAVDLAMDHEEDEDDGGVDFNFDEVGIMDCLGVMGICIGGYWWRKCKWGC